MPRHLTAFLFLLVFSGCAPSEVGTIDLRGDLPAIQGGRLLVVVAPSAPRRAFTTDTVRVAEFVPLDSLGASSYRRVLADTLVAALRASGRWTDVQIGTIPPDAELVSGSHRIVRSVPRQRDPVYGRAVLTVPAASPEAFGPDVDAVLVVSDAGLGFVKKQVRALGPDGAPAVLGMPGVVRVPVGDDAVVAHAALVLWNDATGTVAGFGTPTGMAPIRSRLFSSSERRSPRGLARESLDAFLDAASAEIPALGLARSGGTD